MPEADYRSLLETLPTRAARPERFEEIARSGCPNGTVRQQAVAARIAPELARAATQRRRRRFGSLGRRTLIGAGFALLHRVARLDAAYSAAGETQE
jgi:hypothetical protein